MVADPQATLLSYLAQEVTAHGTILVGLIAAMFAYFTLKGHEAYSKTVLGTPKRRGSEVLSASVLLILVAGIVFVVGRMMSYGQLTYFTIHTNPYVNESLGTYYGAVHNASISFGAPRIILGYFPSDFWAGGLFSIWVSGLMTLMLWSPRRMSWWRFLFSGAMFVFVLLSPAVVSHLWANGAERDYVFILLYLAYFAASVAIWPIPWRDLFRGIPVSTMAIVYLDNGQTIGGKVTQPSGEEMAIEGAYFIAPHQILAGAEPSYEPTSGLGDVNIPVSSVLRWSPFPPSLAKKWKDLLKK